MKTVLVSPVSHSKDQILRRFKNFFTQMCDCTSATFRNSESAVEECSCIIAFIHTLQEVELSLVHGTLLKMELLSR